MKIIFSVLFCFLFAAVLTSSTQETANAGYTHEITYPSSPSQLDPLGLKYTPDQTIVTKDNVVYLLSRDNLSIFRWSISQRRYLPPITLHTAPVDMAYSPDTNRLYLEYLTYDRYYTGPHITQIDLNQNPAVERLFVYQDSLPYHLLPFGSYVFIKNPSGHTTYSQDGEIISQITREGGFIDPVWNPINRRMYLFDLSYRIFWESIDEDGMIDPVETITELGFYQGMEPVGIKPDGTHLFFMNGKVLDIETFNEIASLDFPVYVREATWKKDYFYTLTPHIEGSVLNKWDAQTYNFEGNTVLIGNPIRLLPVPEGLLVITNILGRTWFTILNERLEIIYETVLYNTHVPLVSKDYCNGFIDEFSYPLSGWLVEEDEYVRSEYLEGEFRVLTKDDRYFYTYAAPSCRTPESIHYSVELDARWVGEPGFAYGIVYQISPDYEQFSLFLVNTDYQEVSVYQYSSYGFTELMAPEYTPAIKPGNETNHLKIFQFPASSTYLEINGSIVGNVSSWTEGPAYVGLVSVPYDGFPTSDARFDNFRFTFSPPFSYGASGLNTACSPPNRKIELKNLSNPAGVDRTKP